MGQLAKTRRVLDRVGCMGSSNNTAQHLFGQRDEDEAGRILPGAVWLGQDDWEAMGRPDVITVTIEPGDHLNG